MAQETSIACSLTANRLPQRLAEISEIGAAGLIAHSAHDGSHQLRFRADGEARRRLEAVIAAESECCSFLDLSLEERGNELLLGIGSTKNGQAFADALAAAFTGAGRPDSAGSGQAPTR